MAYASTDITPTSMNLGILFSITDGAIKNPVTFKVKPTNSSGTAFDCTGTIGASLNVIGNPALPAVITTDTAASPTIVSADATGVTLSLTAAALSTMIDSIGTLVMAASVQISDGVNQLVAAKGTIQISLVP